MWGACFSRLPTLCSLLSLDLKFLKIKKGTNLGNNLREPQYLIVSESREVFHSYCVAIKLRPLSESIDCGASCSDKLAAAPEMMRSLHVRLRQHQLWPVDSTTAVCCRDCLRPQEVRSVRHGCLWVRPEGLKPPARSAPFLWRRSVRVWVSEGHFLVRCDGGAV